VDEEDGGNLFVVLGKVTVDQSGDDGIQFTELGEGKIKSVLNKVSVSNSAKYGIKAEQWVVEDEDALLEPPGEIFTRKVLLTGNSQGNVLKVRNIDVE